MEITEEKAISIKRNVLKVTRRMMVAGQHCAPGAFIEVSRSDAKCMTRRGVAVEAIEAEIGEASVIVAPVTPEEIRAFLDDAA